MLVIFPAARHFCAFFPVMNAFLVSVSDCEPFYFEGLDDFTLVF